MGLVSPTQSNPGDTIEAADINNPVNQLATAINGGLDANNLADNAVTTAKIADNTVTNAKLSTTAGQPGGAFQTWTPTIGGFSSNPTGGLYYYMQVGKKVTLFIAMPNNGTSNATTITLSLPVAARSVTGMQWNGFGQALDNGGFSSVPALLNITAASPSTLTVYLNFGAGGFTASGSKRLAAGTIEYETA